MKKRLCIAIIIMVLAFFAVSCGGEKPADKTSDSTESTHDDTVMSDEADETSNSTETEENLPDATEKIESIVANGNKLEKIKVFGGKYGMGYAGHLAALISDRLGIEAEVAETEAEANIIFSETNDLVEKGNWGIACGDKAVYLVGANEIEARKAYYYFENMLKKNSGELTIEGLVKSERQITEEEYRKQKQLVIYPEFPEQIRRIYDYDVSVTMDGKTEKLPVYNHVVESNVSRRGYPDMYRRFSLFAFSGGNVRVDIKVKTDFASYTVFPSAKNFKHDFKNGVISVYLDEPDYFGIQLDDKENSIISVFADYPEFPDLIPKDDDPNFVRISGWYEPESGTIIYENPYTFVYIEPGAVFNARIRFVGDHAHLYGRGAIVDPFENIYEYDIRDGGTESKGFNLLTFMGEYSVTDGPVLMDARCFNIVVKGAYSYVHNMKAMSAMMTTDGITIGSHDSEINHCWLYVGDNGIVVSNAENIYSHDVAIGTTCAALFPQLTITNCLYEDINVFRADDGIVNNRYNGSQPVDRVITATFRRLNAVEQYPGTTHIFQGRNMGVASKVFNFEDVSVVAMKEMLLYSNSDGYMFTQNYTMNFKNLAVDGEVIYDASNITETVQQGAVNYKTVTSDKNFKPLKRNSKVVNYTAPDKIFIGARRIFLSTEAKNQGGKIMLPTAEICKLLRVKPISNAEFVSTDELVKAKVIEKANTSHGDLYLIPVYSGKNLLLEDEGEISYFAEQICYQLDLVTSEDRDGIIYTVYGNNAKSVSAGISRIITNEVQMYGAGTYKLSFSALGCESGSLKMVDQKDDTSINNIFGVDTDWKNVSFNITVSESDLTRNKIVFTIVGESRVLDYFSLRDFSLTKVK